MLTLAEADVARLSAALAAEPPSLRWRRLLLFSEAVSLSHCAVARRDDLDG